MHQGIAVYVQSLPISAGDGKIFADAFQNAEFELSHSSKVALSYAKTLGTHDVTAIGHGPVLHEALARGATNAISVPFCDNPLDQARSIPCSEFSRMIVPESVDGPFTGASLAGVLVFLYGFAFRLVDENEPKTLDEKRSVVLVKDCAACVEPIDVRRIKQAVEMRVEDLGAEGRIRVLRVSPESAREELKGEAEETSKIISKRIGRYLETTYL